MYDRKIVLFDIDGTIADLSHRLYHIHNAKPPNWDAFHADCVNDTLIEPVKELCNALILHHDIWFVTGRPENTRLKTKEWLFEHEVLGFHRLIMRPDGDHTPDYELKIQWLKDGTIPRDRVLFAIEDRDSVVAAYRAEGITCIQVAAGAY